jgi:hypothetical protein
MSAWDIRADGFALGTERVISWDRHRVVLTPVWTDADGVSVNVDAGDEPLPPRVALDVAVGLIQLAGLKAPTLDEISAS